MTFSVDEVVVACAGAFFAGYLFSGAVAWIDAYWLRRMGSKRRRDDS